MLLKNNESRLSPIFEVNNYFDSFLLEGINKCKFNDMNKMKIIRISIIISMVFVLFLYEFILAQNVGIGTITPTLGKLEIRGVAGLGSTVAAFGTDGAGLSIQKDAAGPVIGFNHYRDQTIVNSQGKHFANGYAAVLALEVNSGKIKVDMYDYGIGAGFTAQGRRALTIFNSGNIGIRSEASGNATFIVPKLNNFNGSAVFSGTTYSSYFQYSPLENTYIRGGIDNSKVILNDVPGGKVGIGKLAETPTLITSTLSVFGSMKLPGKSVNADYTLTEDDFTILVNMSDDANKIINISLPTPSASTDGRIYIIRGINMPQISNYDNATGWIKVNNITEEYYSSNKLYYVYESGGVFGSAQLSLMESFTVQCIGNQWRIIVRSHDSWFQ